MVIIPMGRHYSDPPGYSYSQEANCYKMTTLSLKEIIEAILKHLNLEVQKVEEQSTIILKPIIDIGKNK